jgi:hypothetical protein
MPLPATILGWLIIRQPGVTPKATAHGYNDACIFREYRARC